MADLRVNVVNHFNDSCQFELPALANVMSFGALRKTRRFRRDSEA